MLRIGRYDPSLLVKQCKLYVNYVTAHKGNSGWKNKLLFFCSFSKSSKSKRTNKEYLFTLL